MANFGTKPIRPLITQCFCRLLVNYRHYETGNALAVAPCLAVVLVCCLRALVLCDCVNSKALCYASDVPAARHAYFCSCCCMGWALVGRIVFDRSKELCTKLSNHVRATFLFYLRVFNTPRPGLAKKEKRKIAEEKQRRWRAGRVHAFAHTGMRRGGIWQGKPQA